MEKETYSNLIEKIEKCKSEEELLAKAGITEERLEKGISVIQKKF